MLRRLTALCMLIAALTAVGSAQATSKSAWVVRGLLCIHTHEGSWNDRGAPYWGGLQMDLNFQSAYGRKYLHRWGTADHWPVWAQINAGVRGAYARHGFNPWPRTARMCGLPLYW